MWTGGYLIDANIWILSYTPNTSPEEREPFNEIYGALLQKLFDQDIYQIYITPILVSEYINTRMRRFYRSYLKSSHKKETEYGFKKYRNDKRSDFQKNIKIILD